LRGDEGDLLFEIEIHERGEVITVWSKRCKKSTTQYSPHCHECSALHGRLEDLAQITRDVRKGTNYKFMSHDQLRELLVERNDELDRLKLEVCFIPRRSSSKD
jgi:hypothetical protein